MPYIVKTSGADANSKAVVQIVQEMLNIEARSKIIDDDGKPVKNPTPGYPQYVDEENNIVYTASSYRNNIYVGEGVDIAMLASNIQFIITRIQPRNHFKRKIVITNAVTTLVIPPTHISTLVDPTEQCGRAIYGGDDTDTRFGFYQWIIRRMKKYDRECGNPGDLCSIVWDIDDVLTLENRDRPIRLMDTHFHAYARDVIGKAPGEIVIVPGISDPGILMLQPPKYFGYGYGTGLHPAPTAILNAVTYETMRNVDFKCDQCNCKLFNEGYTYRTDLHRNGRIFCIRCVSNMNASSACNLTYGVVKIRTTREELLSLIPEMREFVEDVQDDVESITIEGIRVFLGKKHAYTPSIDAVIHAGASFLNNPSLSGRKIYPAHVFL